MSEVASEPASNARITCKIDGALCHSIQIHLRDNHPTYTVKRYQEEFPGEPLFSEMAQVAMNKKRNEMANAAKVAKAMVVAGGSRQPFHEVFGLGEAKAAKNARGGNIMVAVFDDHDENAKLLLAERDPNYVFDIELTKTILIALELNTGCYLWGYHGTGKTTVLEQVAACVRRPFMRVQHTVGTEESHIIGQYVVQDGATVFQYGPLAIAMIEGYIYCADEYDRAIAPVTSVYQPVLEGKPLYIKEAPPEMRLVKPHPNFRFVATGNTNGSGDETGLYQGTQMQDAANYSRFGVTVEVGYMDPKVEVMVVSGQAQIDKKDAEKIVSFANDFREAFKGGKVASTISPRELINAGRYAVMKGGDWRAGLKTAWGARLSRVDREVADSYAQRIWA